MITTVVTAFPVCMYTIFPCFSKEKKNNNSARKEKRRDQNREKKREISYFSAKIKVHRKQENCSASSARETRPIQWTKMNYTA